MDAQAVFIKKSKANMAVLGALIVLTAITVSASYFDFGFLNIAIALGIATTKASLVVLRFMHLGHEERAVRLMVIIACLLLAIIIGFVFFDIGSREGA